MMPVQIGTRSIGPEFSPYVIAEIGVNHDGDADRAHRLIELASEAGADAVKFQYFVAEALMSKASRLAAYQANLGERDPIEMLRRLQLSPDDFASLIDRAHSLDLHATVTIFSLEHVAPLGRLPWDAFKIASPDVINLPLIERIRALGRPVIISTGAADRTDIETTVRARLGDAYLHCVSAYPTPDDCAQLGGIAALHHLIHEIEANPRPVVGYSDHTTSVLTGMLAVSCGACVLEKHFTDDQNRRGPDHAASLEPAAFREYVAGAHRAWHMIGERSIIVQENERDVRTLSRQSVVPTRSIRRGERIAASDLTIKRPGTGLPPHYLTVLPGCFALRDIEADYPIEYDDVDLTASRSFEHEPHARELSC